MVSTKKALIASLSSAAVVGIIYWSLQLVIKSISPWIVGIIVFFAAFAGMKWRD